MFAEEWRALCSDLPVNPCNRPLASYPSLAADGRVIAFRYGQGQSTMWDFSIFLHVSWGNVGVL